MGKYEEIEEARKILGISEEATIEEIKRAYRLLLKKWHPDKKREDEEKCNEMIHKIVKAYKIIMNYCNNYKISFSRESVIKHLSDEDWWYERFGEDPLWGKK